MKLAALLEIDADDRLHALETLSPDLPGVLGAVRDALLEDEDATVRAAAASFLERARPAIDGCDSAVKMAAAALTDALYDTHPSVRMAACRALAKLVVRDALPVLRRLALEEPIWWVRRAAVLAAARIDHQRAIPLLRDVLDDPFWRVRHAAVRALVVLGQANDEAVAKITAEISGSERAHGALKYLERRFGPGATTSGAMPSSSTTSAFEGEIGDPDPAVIAARLEHGREVSGAALAPSFMTELALYLGDPHEALRRAASERLRSSRDVRAFLVASLWLEEPRIPHATATVVALLDSLAGDVLDELLEAALDQPDSRPGLAAWALSFVAAGEIWDRDAAIFAAMDARTPLVRRTATAALSSLLASPATEARSRADAAARLKAALGDPDEDVRRLAVHGLVRGADAFDKCAVLELPFSSQPVLVKRLLTIAAHETTDITTLRLAARDSDPETRARALAALHEAGLLDSEELAAARISDDAWVRSAVLDPRGALEALGNDVDPKMKRMAFDCAARGGRALEAARIAFTDDDTWLRTRAAERLARSHEDEDLVRVLRLSRDPEPAVRAAAADVLDLSRDWTERLERVRERSAISGAGESSETDEVVRNAADTWLGLRAKQLIEGASERNGREPLDAKILAGERRASAPAAAEVASPRSLGRTGIVMSPLVVSGAYEPSVASLFRATSSGCNAFFWEPRYRNLTTFLRTSAERGAAGTLVIAGTYHATARAIRADVEQALRRLRRDRIDVFLVFWARSPARLEGEVPRALELLKREGLVRAIGFSTHDRALAEAAIAGPREGKSPWDVVMVRHSAAHPGAEEGLFRCAEEHGVGVLGFSATSYGRLLRRVGAKTNDDDRLTLPTAAECYRYTLSQRGVTACVSAPRGGRELIANLDVLQHPTLDASRLAELRRHGLMVREESLDFAGNIRRFPALPEGLTTNVLDDALDELTRDEPFFAPSS